MPSPLGSPRHSQFVIDGWQETGFHSWDQVQSQPSTSGQVLLDENSTAHESVSHPLITREDDSLEKDFQQSETSPLPDDPLLLKDDLILGESQCEILVHEVSTLPGTTTLDLIMGMKHVASGFGLFTWSCYSLRSSDRKHT